MSVQPAIATTSTRTHCPYCALQCGMQIGTGLTVAGDESFPVNDGALCIKGWTSTSLINHPERLLSPLARNERRELEATDWDTALDLIARGFKRAQETHGRGAIGVLGGGSLTNEKAYLMGKFARVALETGNIDYNGRFCMSSAAAAQLKAFGVDRGLPFPLADIPQAEVVLLVGGNIAETMPPMMRYFDQQRSNGGRLIVVDPRFTATAQAAALHLPITPGTDAALANGLLHLLVREGLLDIDYIAARTENFGEMRGTAAAYWPERVERITGIAEAQLLRAATALGQARSAMILTARGPEQQSHGVNNSLALINVALALGLPGKPFSGFGTITGQGNGQGGREHGQKADQLPGYRSIDDIEARRHIAQVWGIDEKDIPVPGKSAYELIDSLGQAGGVRALFSLGFNFAVSAPDAGRVADRLRALDFLLVSDFFLSETAQFADVVLPSAMWAEEEGTMTNLEGRVIRRRRAVEPPTGVMSDIELLCALAKRLGRGNQFSYASAGDVYDELRRATSGGSADYSGITYERIEAENGVFWPCASERHPGTPRLFEHRFPTANGRARFHAIRYEPPAEEPDADYPLYLTTGRVTTHYQSGTQTRRVDKLREISGEPQAELHPHTAKLYGLATGHQVTLETRRGRAQFRVKVDSGIRRDTIFVPFHWGGGNSANRLTNPALDPISRMPEFKICAVRVVPRDVETARY